MNIKYRIIFLLISCLPITSCHKDKDSESIFTFEDYDPMLIADGITKKKLVLQLNDEWLYDKYVKFTTTNGTFMNISSAQSNTMSDNIVVKAQGDKAYVYLVSSTKPDDHVVISALVDENLYELGCTFLSSRPDTFYLETDGNEFPVTQTSINIRTKLITSNGRPITGTQYVNFSSEIIQGDSLDFFLPPSQIIALSSDGAECVATLRKQNTDTLTIKVTAKVVNQNKEIMAQQITINFNK
jgi:hypothetical protein